MGIFEIGKIAISRCSIMQLKDGSTSCKNLNNKENFPIYDAEITVE